MVTGFAQGITAAQAFVRIGVEDKVSAALAVVQGKLNVFAANVGRVGASIQRIGLGGGIFGAGIIYGIKKATEESSRATEVNTAYAATFRELTGSAEQFANTLATRFKRDVIDVKDIQRSFFGLFAGQGFERGFSKQAANIFTRLSYDFSSFFNQTVDEAAGRMLSALSNSAEVVQRFGFNVRAPALESAFKDLGINKSIEQASEAEKLIARVMILLQTSGEAQLNIFGDIDRTINEFANQTRGLQSSITIFLRAIGKPFEQALAPIIGGFAKATMGAANWVSENPKLVTQIGGLTAGLVTGGAALISFGFALRVVSFSMGPFVSLLSAPILVFAKLFDVVGFATAAVFHFARFGISAVMTSVRTVLPILDAMRAAVLAIARVMGLTIPVISLFARAAMNSFTAVYGVVSRMATAFNVFFWTLNRGAMTSILTFFGFIRTVRNLPAAASAAAGSMIVLSRTTANAFIAPTIAVGAMSRVVVTSMRAATTAMTVYKMVVVNLNVVAGGLIRIMRIANATTAATGSTMAIAGTSTRLLGAATASATRAMTVYKMVIVNLNVVAGGLIRIIRIANATTATSASTAAIAASTTKLLGTATAGTTRAITVYKMVVVNMNVATGVMIRVMRIAAASTRLLGAAVVSGITGMTVYKMVVVNLNVAVGGLIRVMRIAFTSVRMLGAAAVAAPAAIAATATSMIVAARTVFTFGTAARAATMGFLGLARVVAAISAVIVVQIAQGMRAAFVSLLMSIQSAVVGLVEMGIAGVASFGSIALSAAAAMSQAILPFIANVAAISAVAAIIGVAFWVFADEIKAIFSSAMAVVSEFSSSAVSVFFNFLNGSKAIFWELVSFAKMQFYSLLEIGSRTFSALNDAMTAGDFKLAFQIAFAGAKEAAFSFMFDAVDRWGGTIESFVKGLIELKFWFLKTFTEITGFVKLAFDNMETYRQTAVNSISEGIIASLVKVGAVDAEVMQTLKEDIGRQQQSKADAIKAKTAADVATLEGDKQAALGSVNAGVKEFSDGLKRGLRAAQREADALAAKAAGKANAGNLAAANLGELPGVQDLLDQIKSQTIAGSAGEKTVASLKGLDIRSSEGHQSFVDALNNKNSMKGIQDKLSDIEKKLVEVVPKKIGQEFAAEMENQIGVAGLPNQTKK